MNLILNLSLLLFEHEHLSCYLFFMLKFSVCIHKVLPEGSVSQKFSFYVKNGNFLKLDKMKLGPTYIKCLRHASLHLDLKSTQN